MKTNKKLKQQANAQARCHNYLRVYGPSEEELARFEQAATGCYPRMTVGEKSRRNQSDLNFHSLVPIPEKVVNAAYGAIGRDWEIQHWGAEGGALGQGDAAEALGGFCDDRDKLEYEFDTLSTPPIAFLKSVSKAWPSLLLLLKYDEPTCFKGMAKAKAGKVEHFQIKYPKINQTGKEASHA